MSPVDARIAALTREGDAFAIATVVRTMDATSAKPGAKAVILSDGTIAEGWIGGGCARGAIARAARDAIADGQPRFVSLRPEDLLDAEGIVPGEERDGIRFARNGCPSRGSMDVFVEAVLPHPELTICGDSPVALALADLAGRFDFRRCLAAPGLKTSPVEGLDRVIDGFTFDTSGSRDRFIVVATQGKGDEVALRAAVSAGAQTIAFVGSRRKFETLRDRLVANGVPAEDLARVRSPAGLDIKAITPNEIALSILAEIVALRRSRQRAEARVQGVADQAASPKI